MFQVENSAILSTFIKLPIDILIYVLSIFEWPFYTGLNVYYIRIYITTLLHVTPMDICIMVSFILVKLCDLNTLLFI